MENSRVKELVGDTPYMQLSQGNLLSAFMEAHDIQKVLELGVGFGVSTSYMAATLARLGRGNIVTIDLLSSRERNPNVIELIERIGQSDRVTSYFEPTSYTWRLMKFLEQDPRPVFDFCYLDGAHSWYVDGFAFYLVDLLLEPGGWIIFDDLDWSFGGSASLAMAETVAKMTEEEKTIPQVRKVYELLVRPHPNYHNFRVEDGWAFAQKKDVIFDQPTKREVVVEVEVKREHYGLGWFLMKCASKLRGTLNSVS